MSHDIASVHLFKYRSQSQRISNESNFVQYFCEGRAAALILIGVLHMPFLLIVPLILLGMGVWILATGGSYYQRAWGIVVALAGGLWLLHIFTSLSLYILAGVFFAVTGILVILGSRK